MKIVMAIESNPLIKHQDKLTYLLIIASIVITVVAIAWTIFFISIRDWLSVGVESILIALGYIGYSSAKRNNTKVIAHILFPLLFIVMCIVCIFFDVPNTAVPRSNHHYFLPMVLYAYVLYQDEHPYLKIAVPALISLAFLMFASTHTGINLSGMTNDHRLVGVWVTNSVALMMLFLVALIMQSDFKVRHTLELELSKALLKNEIELYFQPQVDERGRTLGAEALARWQHPTFGTIEPDVFIPLAEKSELILHLGKYVLASACHQLTLWAQNEATAQLTLSVNISVKQFQSTEFVPHIITLLNEAKVNAHKLQLEITESIFAHDLETIQVKMTQLKSYGIKFSLDDFGTGYSSLAYVKKLPLDELKIDKSFIKEVLTSVNDASITKMIISLAHELHIAIIAEGVETPEQQQFLINNGCLNFQGYLYSRPLPIAEFNAFALVNNQ
jgi:EAL domain-containing protein (putative c-di-GMP-specific phosphodiesterase class I)